MTSPLSKIVSMTSASPDGDGPPPAPAPVCPVILTAPPARLAPSCQLAAARTQTRLASDKPAGWPAVRKQNQTSQASAPARWPRPPLTARRPPLPAHSCQRPAATPGADQQTASASSNEDRPPQPGRDL